MAEWKELPSETKEGKPIVYVRQAGRTTATGYERVDPRTGQTIGHLGRIDVERREVGGQKGYSFTFLPARPKVEVSIRRSEEKKETAELARKEAEFEAKRIREGKIKAEDVVLTQKGAAEELRKILEKEAKEPKITREEEKEIEKLSGIQRRTLETLRAQGKKVEVRDGLLILEKRGRVMQITRTGASVRAPPSAVISPEELELRRLRRVKRVKVVKPKEPVFIEPKREVTPEELVRQVQIEREEVGIPPSEIRAAPKAEGFIETVIEKQRRLEFEAQREMGLRRQVLSFGAVGLGVVTGFAEPILHPIEFIKGTIRTITQPKEAGLAIGEELRGRPAGLVGTLIGRGLLFKTISKVAPKPAVTTIDIKGIKTTFVKSRFEVGYKTPSGTRALIFTKGGAEVTTTAVAIPPPPTVLSLELGSRALILGGVGARGIFLGTPSIAPQLEALPPGQEIKPGTPTETQILQKALQELPEDVVTARGQQAIPLARSIIRKTRTTQSRYMRDLPRATKRLDEKGVNIIRDLAQEKEAVIFGSFSRKAQTIEPGELAKDIDVRLIGATPEQIKAVQQEAIRRLRAAGYDTKAGKEASVLVRQPSGEYAKAVEFRGEFGIEGEDVPPQVLGVEKFGKPITIEGQQVTTLAEELRGVTQGVIRIRKTNGAGQIDIYPPERRIKDIPELFISAETLAKSKLIPRPQLKKDIERLRALFPEVEDISATEVKIKMADFSRREAVSPPSFTPFIVSPTISPIGISPIPRPSPPSPPSPPSVVSPPPSPIPSPPSPPSISPPSVIPPSPTFISPPSPPSPRPSPPSPPSVVSPPSPPSPTPSITPSVSITPSPPPSPPSISPPSPPSPPSISPPSPPITTPRKPSEEKVTRFVSKAPQEKAYDILIRKGEKRGDKFVKIDEEGLPENKAKRRLARILDNYIEASGRIRKTDRLATELDIPPPDLSKFRSPVAKSKLPRDTIIELAKHRLDSTKEVQQISYFKELAKRKKQQLQTQISFIKTQQKKQQLQSVIASKKTEQISFVSSSKGKKQKVKPIKFI